MEMMKKLYFYDDIPTEAGKEKAREWYRDGDDMPFLEEYVSEIIREELEKIGYTVEGLEAFYSLSYSQGDGVCFKGSVTDKESGKVYTVKQSGRYFHEYAMYVYTEDEDGDEIELPSDSVEAETFRNVATIAKRKGYKYIKEESEDETVAENIRGNEYTFTAEGVRMDSDNA